MWQCFWQDFDYVSIWFNKNEAQIYHSLVLNLLVTEYIYLKSEFKCKTVVSVF